MPLPDHPTSPVPRAQPMTARATRAACATVEERRFSAASSIFQDSGL